MKYVDQIRAAIVIQFLNSFVTGVIGVAVPLIMKEQGIDIAVIGFVFASMPMIFQVMRMIFGVFSDFWGRKPFFILNGLLGLIGSSVYYIAHAPIDFLAGKILQGTTEGSIWAVNRAFLLENSRNKWAALARLRTTSLISTSVGSLVAGFLIVTIFYGGTMVFCTVLSVLLVPISLSLTNGKGKKFSAGEALGILDFRKKSRVFQKFLVLFAVKGLSVGFRGSFILPLFLSTYGFDVQAIGTLIGIQTFISGLFTYFLFGRVKLNRLILASGFSGSAILFLLAFSTSNLISILVVILGVTDGLMSISQEGIFSQILAKRSYGTDVGLIWMGFHIGETFSLAVAGLLISMWGFTTSFSISAVILLVFSFASRGVLERE